jgi:hypothetical protein
MCEAFALTWFNLYSGRFALFWYSMPYVLLLYYTKHSFCFLDNERVYWGASHRRNFIVYIWIQMLPIQTDT